ncbi:MAG: serine hydroxymethyltransferase [Candidatus Aenigmarchaeota archaeon]|nr:serine hydroxymethyltransferase [Candidatus Aenigmarchaeota archaeon]
MLEILEKQDPQVAEAIKNELNRQRFGLEMIPSENFTSVAVLEALGTVLTNKYSEGYPHRRYYGGNQFIDVVEDIAIERAKKLFGVPYANVQPYSGTPANLAVYLATCKPGDVIMGQNLPDGGHLSHGWKVSASGIIWKSVPYHVKPDGYIDLDEVRKLARENKPRLIWCGASAYPRELPFEEFAEIADEVEAYYVADIAHIAGLVVAGVHKSPVPYCHIVTTTTHKTLCGPRGAIIMVTEKGLEKDPDLANKIDKAVFPGLQGGPHDHQTAAIAVALGEALKPEFKEYGKQIVKNCKALAESLMKNGLKLVTNGTDNHMLLIDLTPFGKGKGMFAEYALDSAGITVNKNTIPAEPSSPFYPSGIRLGTPALTTRGMKEKEMELIGDWIAQVINEVKGYEMPDDKNARNETIQKFRKEIVKNQKIKKIKKEVIELCKRFPLYPGL